MFDLKTYEEYEERLYSYARKVITDEEVSDLFDELLKFLPNNGKLYKYKSLESFHIDELEEKYIWLSSAKNLNDKKDCTFNSNYLQEQEVSGKHLNAEDMKCSAWSGRKILRTLICMRISAR